MNKVKITVLRKTFNSELAAEYGTDSLSLCPMLNEGQVFYTYCKKPEGLCDEAWNAISQYVFALAHGAGKETFYLGDWIKIPGVAICSCNDGLRPVIFKVEGVENNLKLSQNDLQETIEESKGSEQKQDCELDGAIEEEHTDDDNQNVENTQVIIRENPKSEGLKQELLEKELVVSVYKDTKSIDLLDKFESISDEGKKEYKRMVINPGMYWYGTGIHYQYVIERGYESDYVGDITFTEFKKGERYDLNKHIQSELSSDIIERYKDSSEFYRLRKPYHLRAQNSSNRTGYGWEWDWSYGVGDYTEGTLYGETTDYIFAGVYISSSYSYNPNTRKHSTWSSTATQTLETSSALISVRGYTQGIYKLVPYTGKLSDIAIGKTESLVIPVQTKKRERLIPVSLCEFEGKIYITQPNFDAHIGNFKSALTLELRKI